MHKFRHTQLSDGARYYYKRNNRYIRGMYQVRIKREKYVKKIEKYITNFCIENERDKRYLY